MQTYGMRTFFYILKLKTSLKELKKTKKKPLKDLTSSLQTKIDKKYKIKHLD